MVGFCPDQPDSGVLYGAGGVANHLPRAHCPRYGVEYARGTGFKRNDTGAAGCDRPSGDDCRGCGKQRGSGSHPGNHRAGCQPAKQAGLVGRRASQLMGRIWVRGRVAPDPVDHCPRLGRACFSLLRMSRTAFSVVSQSIQASVTDTPYFRSARFSGMDWLPQFMLLSTIRLWIDWLPSRIWWVTSCITSGWMPGSLLELAWLQSTMMDLRKLAFSSACSHRATLTES